MRKILQHIRNNKGDSHVSKMTIVAVVFVVGAILLVLTTSAFRQPINNWFSKVTAGWFANSNGMYEADNPMVGYQRNANGTYQGLYYYYYDATKQQYYVLTPTEAAKGENNGAIIIRYYSADGTYLYTGGITSPVGAPIYASEDGLSLSNFGKTYQAYLPNG